MILYGFTGEIKQIVYIQHALNQCMLRFGQLRTVTLFIKFFCVIIKSNPYRVQGALKYDIPFA